MSKYILELTYDELSILNYCVNKAKSELPMINDKVKDMRKKLKELKESV